MCVLHIIEQEDKNVTYDILKALALPDKDFRSMLVRHVENKQVRDLFVVLHALGDSRVVYNEGNYRVWDEKEKKMIAVAERLGGAAYKAEGDSVANLKAMREVAQACARLADQYSASVSTYTLSTSKALLDLVDQSFKQYGAAETK